MKNLKEYMYAQIWNQRGAFVWDAVHDRVWKQVFWDRIDKQVWDEIWDEVEDITDEKS